MTNNLFRGLEVDAQIIIRGREEALRFPSFWEKLPDEHVAENTTSQESMRQNDPTSKNDITSSVHGQNMRDLLMMTK
jgi:hypothetical protein